MTDRTLIRKLEDFENPRIVKLREGLYGASFFLMKMLPARFMLERAAEDGLLKPGATICESSSGTFGLALAMLAASYGYKLVLVSDWAVDRHLHRRLLELGAQVEIVDRPAPKGGFQQARLDRLAAHLKHIPDSYWPSQYGNPNNPLAYAKFAELLIDRVGKIDCLVGSVGSGGSMCGTAKFLRVLFPELYAVGVDTPNSVLFGQPSGPLNLRGLGGNILPSNLDHRHFDEVHWLTPAEAFHATHKLHRDHGLFLGPTSGATYRVADWWASRNPGKDVICIFPDEGHRYVETVYDEDWLTSVPGWPLAERPEPAVAEAPTEELTGWSSYPWGRRTLHEVLSSCTDHVPTRSLPQPTPATTARLQSMNPDFLGSNAARGGQAIEPIRDECGATLKALSCFDSAAVAHLKLGPEQEQFAGPLDLVFSQLQISSRPELEHPFSIVVRDEVVGFFVLREKDAVPEWAPLDVITLHSLRVDRDYQRKGYGKGAIRLIARWILTNRPDVNRLMLAVNVRNVMARDSYLKSGFWDTGTTYCGPIGTQNILEYKIN
ncbi:pyridoxal-phosphate dependent enzyme [Mesorhizobium sp.]|uniref:pyridoxal-phosphate dependent enzyme n=1 Tax=Mesorhizobium sp. TaxID=1871066 RepID=UPI000FE9C37D|nr:pyridoxal-phosphate dependent enzyme [Mesorhizobium sp.]RWM38699.1 MAG: pyridoxal-phosphate dependent enzyme [Mesorhizobium sp.]